MMEKTKPRGDREAVDTAEKAAGDKAGRNSPVKIKLCGLSRTCDIQTANELRPDYIGFVFAPKSRRYVPPEKASELKRMLDPQIRAVGVFVDEDPRAIAELVGQGIIDAVQLHGSEDEDDIRRLREQLEPVSQRFRSSEAGGGDRIPIIKAFSIRTKEDAKRAEHSSADCILVDSPGGGTGMTFDWNLLREVHRPYFLAGGLTPGNAGEAVNRLRPYGVDVSSGIETDGEKDRDKMKAFVCAVRSSAETDHDAALNSADTKKG